MNHYVYKLEHIETGEFYFGCRSSKIDPKEDLCYFGSMKSWKPNKEKLKKYILKQDFLNREDAIKYEVLLIKENINHSLNRNYHVPGLGFHTKGMKRSEEWKEWNTARLLGENNPAFGKYRGFSVKEAEKRLKKISDIDLKVFGWVMKVSKRLNITHTQTKRFIKKYYKGEYYTRNSPSK